MKLGLSLLIAGVCGTVGVATADINRGTGDLPDNPLATPWSRPLPMYVMTGNMPVYDNHVAHAVPGFSNVVYLNNCKPGGCNVRPGDDNSTANPPTSIVPNQNSVVSPFAYSDAVWQQVVDCVRKTYAPFAVQVTDVRPPSGDFHMGIVAGIPQDVQMSAGVGGVSPFTCGYIPNAVSYSFANVYNGNVDDICWTVAQETAHSWGLDHKFDNRDPMTYLSSGPTRKVFQNQPGQCGEFSARACQCGGNVMNSYDEIIQTFGGSTPTPPMVGITAPQDGASVAAGFPIRATITDDIGVNKAELSIDGKIVSTLMTFPYVWNAPMTLGQGRHKLKVTGYDIANTSASVEIQIALGKVCEQARDCEKSTDVCVDGRCVLGGSVTGGLGTTCVNNSDCASGKCGADATGDHFCVEDCDPAADGCPSGFACLSAGEASGVCWPSDEGGCNSSGTGAPGFLVFGIGAMLLVLRRRR